MRKSKLLSRHSSAFIILLFVLIAWSVTSFAQVTSSSPNVPPLNGQYVSPTAYHATYGTAAFVDNGTHGYFTQNHPPPPTLGTTVTHTFGSTINAVIHPNGGGVINISAPAQVTTQVTKSNNDPNPNTGTYQTEMLQLDIAGGTMPPGVMIRESPTLQSTGQTTIADIGGGNYQINSFFDIFTELSVDGGQTWTPTTSGPVHMVLSPAGSIPTMTEWALIACGVLLLIAGAVFIIRRKIV